MDIIVSIAIALFVIILILIFFAVYQIKMAGMNVKDFYEYVRQTEKLNKLSKFCKEYDKLDYTDQIIFAKEAINIFEAFEKVPTSLWENDYEKYMRVLNKYQNIRRENWKNQKYDKKTLDQLISEYENNVEFRKRLEKENICKISDLENIIKKIKNNNAHILIKN